LPRDQKSSTNAAKRVWQASGGIPAGFIHPPTGPRTLRSRIENTPAPAGGLGFINPAFCFALGHYSALQIKSWNYIKSLLRTPLRRAKGVKASFVIS
jgi:hypothetical protein